MKGYDTLGRRVVVRFREPCRIIPPDAPTDFFPGSVRKKHLMRQRLKKRQSLHHSADAGCFGTSGENFDGAFRALLGSNYKGFFCSFEMEEPQWTP